MRQKGRRWLAALVAVTTICLLFAQAFAASTVTPPTAPAWATPSVMAMKRISDITGAQHESTYFQNVNCSLLTYRLVSSDTMQTGCFEEAAYGLFDSDNGIVIYNGSDEGVPLHAYASKQILLPWQKSSELLTLDIQNTGGEFISLYRNPLTAVNDQRNLIGQLTGKTMAGPSDIGLRDTAGQRLLLNSDTIAFSDNGSWLVAETLTGSFVRINLASLTAIPFAPAYGTTGSPGLLQSQVAVSNNGHYIAIHNKIAGSFKVYDMQNCSGNLCKSYDYQPYIAQNIGSYQAIRHVRFVNNGLVSFEVQAVDPTHGGVYELAPTDSIRSLIDYLGLGDSYTSGEGAFDYQAGTDTEPNSCHLSAHSYPVLLTHDLFSALGGHSVACSGATIRDVGSTADTYRGQVSGVQNYAQLETSNSGLLDSVYTNYLPGYIAQQRFVERYQPRIVTVSVGGNDIGFEDILLNCVIPHLSRHLSDQSCYNTYEDRQELLQRIDRTVPRWTALYKQLAATVPGVQLYALGYPSIASDAGSCSLNTLLAKSELEFSEELIRYLNAAMGKAASSAGASYIDISQALAGHRLCETTSYNVAVNGLTAGKDAGLFGVRVFGKESYHPNALGQQLIEQAILQKTHNLTTGNSQPLAPSLSAILSVPKTGRALVNKVPQADLGPQVIRRGKGINVNVKGSEAGLRPNTTYDVKLDGSGGTKIGTITTDSTGNAQGSVTIPIGTAVGGHTIDIIGPGQTGTTTDVTQPVIVPITDTDGDGDGIPNTIDSCPLVANSGQDADHDGIDDVCDTNIVAAPTPPAATGPGTETVNSPPGTNSGPQPPSTAGTVVQPSQPVPPVATAVINGVTTPTASVLGSAVVSTAGALFTGVSPGAQSVSLAPTSSAVLGTAQNARFGAAAAQLNRLRSPTKLPTLHWQRWLGLLVIWWWLLILAIWLRDLFKSNISSQTALQ